MLKRDEFGPNRACVRLSDESVAPEREIAIEQVWEGNVLHSRVTNRSDRPLRIKEVVLFCGHTALAANTPFYGEGYQMLSQYEGTLDAPRLIGAYGTDWGFFRFPRSVFNRDLWTVYNLLLLMPDNEDMILLAFTACRRFSGEFRFKGSYLEIVLDTDDLLLEAGQSWEMEPLLVSYGTDRAPLFDELGVCLNRNHPRMRYREIPTGWCSFCLRPLSVEKVYENARAMVRHIPELKRIQIDGGYEAHNGDWLRTRATLGADMKDICAGIRATGAEAAGYISPFIVSVHSDLYKQHPDWLVQDESGKPYNGVGAMREWYMLDGSHPGAQDYLRHISSVMHDEWGIRYFKLDFLAYGAFPGGRRYDPQATKVEAFRSGLRAIVDTVGHDSFVLGCNAPFWPSLGLIHGNRVTNDAFRSWKVTEGNFRELVGRNWQHDTLWINDPDTVFLEPLDLIGDDDGRPEPSTLTADEFAFLKAYIVASGGMVISGDLLGEMSEERMADLKKLTPPIGVAARFEGEANEIGRIRLPDRELICLFNRADEAKNIEIKLNGTCSIRDFWTDEELGVHPGPSLAVNTPPHCGRVLVCTTV